MGRVEILLGSFTIIFSIVSFLVSFNVLTRGKDSTFNGKLIGPAVTEGTDSGTGDTERSELANLLNDERTAKVIFDMCFDRFSSGGTPDDGNTNTSGGATNSTATYTKSTNIETHPDAIFGATGKSSGNPDISTTKSGEPPTQQNKNFIQRNWSNYYNKITPGYDSKKPDTNWTPRYFGIFESQEAVQYFKKHFDNALENIITNKLSSSGTVKFYNTYLHDAGYGVNAMGMRWIDDQYWHGWGRDAQDLYGYFLGMTNPGSRTGDLHFSDNTDFKVDFQETSEICKEATSKSGNWISDAIEYNYWVQTNLAYHCTKSKKQSLAQSRYDIFKDKNNNSFYPNPDDNST
tara:strand:+ start:173 stop:1213 length:1041 start_codon:yes stop_codon:yes gene_type:complete